MSSYLQQIAPKSWNYTFLSDYGSRTGDYVEEINCAVFSQGGDWKVEAVINKTHPEYRDQCLTIVSSFVLRIP
jgi:hypothetical protein